ncbi:MAG: hypothetical protein WCA28_17185, partial [Bradyrhizobium sp.]
VKAVLFVSMAVRIRRIGIHFDFHIGIIHALFILSNETVINSNPICVSELGAHAASQKRSREPFPNFHQRSGAAADNRLAPG